MKASNTLPMFFVTKSKDALDLRMAQTSWSRKNEFDFCGLNVNVKTDGDGWFVYSNNYYPGWKVYVDNKIASLDKCLGLYMGVLITKGEHDITLQYSPMYLKEFTSMAWFAIALTALFGLILVFRKKQETT
jgi:uncharacterized membrane protein YfhO